MAILENFCPDVTELFGWSSEVVESGDDFYDLGGVHDIMSVRCGSAYAFTERALIPSATYI